MISADQVEIQSILAQLEQAIYNHNQWYESIIRTLVCRLPYNHSDVDQDAHRKCLFGQWYYGEASDALRADPGFAAIESGHRQMHEQARLLLQTLDSSRPVSPYDFDAFANALERLRLQVFTLKHEMESAFYNLDPLTGANNRIGMLTELRQQQELGKRHVQSCCIAMMDIDHFKAVNDTHGHVAGDRILAKATHYVMGHLRRYDKLFRYGGEEFLACLQNTDLPTGYEMVERLRQGLAAYPIDIGEKEPIRITMSFGITALAPEISVEQSVERADKAMYAAKMSGRNCTRIWPASAEIPKASGAG